MICLLARLDPELLPPASLFISATLCDGEDERSASLAAVLDKKDHEDHRQNWLKIRAKLENIVHSLLRVRSFTQRLPDIIS